MKFGVRTVVFSAVASLAGSFTEAAVVSPVTSGLVVAMDGSSVTASGGFVDSWNDQAVAGGLNHAFQSNSSQRPTLITAGLNGHNVLRFDGVNDLLDIGAATALEGDTFTWFLVASAGSIAPGSAQGLLTSAYTSGAGGMSYRLWGTGRNSDGNTFSYARTATSGFVGQNNATASGFATIAATWAADDGVTQSLDGVDGAAFPTDTGATAVPTGHLHTRIGAQSGVNETRLFNGEIAELLIYNRALDDAERLSVEDYLHTKYFTAAAIPTVPEPSALALLGLGSALLAAGFKVSRRRS